MIERLLQDQTLGELAQKLGVSQDNLVPAALQVLFWKYNTRNNKWHRRAYDKKEATMDETPTYAYYEVPIRFRKVDWGDLRKGDEFCYLIVGSDSQGFHGPYILDEPTSRHSPVTVYLRHMNGVIFSANSAYMQPYVMDDPMMKPCRKIG